MQKGHMLYVDFTLSDQGFSCNTSVSVGRYTVK